MKTINYFSLICLFVLMISPALSFGDSDQTTDRITAISRGLEKENPKVKAWQYGWTTAYGAMTAAYTGLAVSGSGDKYDRHDAIVSAATSCLAFGDMLIEPLTSGSGTSALQTLPDLTSEERALKLKKAEDLLKARAEREEKGRSWQTHALSLLVNTISSIIIATDGNRTKDGLVNFASGMLVSEIQIFTTPTDSETAWNAYKKGHTDPFVDHDKKPVFQVSVMKQGFAVTYRF